jgi:hypothetical protein
MSFMSGLKKGGGLAELFRARSSRLSKEVRPRWPRDRRGPTRRPREYLTVKEVTKLIDDARERGRYAIATRR